MAAPKNTAASRAAAGGKVAGLPLWAWGLLLAGAVGLYILTRGSSSSAGIVDKPAVGSSSFDSAAQQPSGGGGGSASNLPDALLSQDTSGAPDQQAQQTDASSSQAPAMIGPSGPTGPQLYQPPGGWFSQPAPKLYLPPGILNPPEPPVLYQPPGGWNFGSTPAPAPPAGPSVTPPLPKGKVLD